MSNFRAAVWSSVGKKLIMGITGLLLFGFIIVHLLGNLSIYAGPDAFNHYSHFLEGLIGGWFVILFEIGLVLILLFHAIAAITVAVRDKYRARPISYKKTGNAGGASHKTISSRSMIITGAVILLFIILHVRMFKFGAAAEIPLENGEEMEDLYSLVVGAFKDPVVTFSYVAVMILLGSHLWHGFWSAFQSLGWTNEKALRCLQGLGIFFALVLAVGFIMLPLYAYLFVDAGSLNLAHLGGQ